MASNIFDFELSAEKTYGSNNYKYSRSATVIKPKPYLLTSFTFYTGIEVNSGTYYVGLSSSSSYNGSNPNEFLDYGYKYVSVSSYDVLNTSFNLNYGKGMYNNLYCYIIKYSGTSKNIFSSSSIGATLIQNSGSFSFNIYKPAHADSISYNWNSKTFNSANGNSYITISRTDIEYTDKLYVQVNYSSIKYPNNTVCIAKNNIAFKGQISKSETPGTKQILTINAYDICFYYKKSDGTGTQGGTGTKLELYSIINNPFTKKEGLVYNANSQTGITGSDYLTTSSGSTTGINAGTYTFKVTAKNGYYFSHSGNSSASTITLTWSISKQTWELKDHCTPHNKRYNGSPQTILEFSTGTLPAGSSCGSTIEMHVADDLNNENAYIFDGYGSISKTNAGTYYFWGKAISLQNPNYVIGNKSNINLGSAIIKRASDPMTFSVGTKSVYCTSDAKAASSTDSAKTVTIDAAAGNIGTVTYSITNRPNSNWTLSGRTLTIPSGTPAGDYSVTVQAEDAAGSNYTNTVRTSTFTVTVTAVTLQNGDYNSSNSDWYAKISSISSGLTAAGGSATITASAGHTHYYYEHYSNGANSSQKSTAVNDGVSIDIDSQTCAGGTNRFSLSGSTLSHSTMGTTTGTDSVTIIAKNNSNSEGRNTATKSVTNSKDSSVTGMNERKQSCYYSYTEYRIINFASVGDISAAGGSSYGQGTGQSRTCYNSSSYTKYDYYYLYTAYYHGDTNAKTYSHTNEASGWTDGDAPGTGSWGGDTTVKGNTISASSLGTTVKSRTYIGTSSVTWNGVSASADIYQAANSMDSSSTAFNGRTQNCYQPYTDYRIINFASVGDIPAGGGKSYGQGTGQSRTCYTGSTYTKYDYYYLYTAYHDGDKSAKTHHYTSTKSGWTDGATPGCGSWGGDTTVYGSEISASSLEKTVQSRAYINTSSVTWNGVSASADIYQEANSVGSYSDTGSISYGTPSLTLTNNLTAGGGSVTVSCSVTDTYYTRRYYTSGSYDDSSRTQAGTACWRITSNGNNRFAYSGSAHTHGSTSYYYSDSKVTHSSMKTNATTDNVGITAYNHNDTTKTSSEKTASVTNSSWWEYDNVTSCSIAYSNSACRNSNGITVSPSTKATQKKRIRYSTNLTSDETNCSITKSYAMTTGNGASINTTTGVITWEENQSTSTRTTNTITCTFTGEGTDKSNTATCTASQDAGHYSYSVPSVSLSYNTNASCGSSSNTSPTNSPSLSYSQTYGWNGRTSGVGTIKSGALVSYSITAGSGVSSINTSSGVITWSENQTLSVRTNKTVSVSVTLNGITGSKSNVSTSQSAGYYTYSELSGGSLSYVHKTAASGTVPPSLASPIQTYGWNGRTSGIDYCTVTAGNYSMTTGNGASINTSTGVITWKANEAGAQRTSNEVSITYAGSGSKTKTLTATATQLADEVSKHSATTSIGSGITAGGGSATVSGSCTRTWVSGYKDYPGISKVEITSQSRYTGVDLTGTASTITRYSVSSTTLSHTAMGTTTGSDYVKITTTFTDGCTATASTYVNNSRTTVWDDMVWATPTVVFSNNSISAGGGSLVATATFSENNKRYYHYTYTDSSANESASAHIEPNYSTPDYGMYMSTPSHEDGWDNTNTWKCTGTWTSSLTVEHRNMTTNVTTDSANITAYNASANSADVWKANTKTISVTNSVGAYYDTSVNTYGTPSLTLTNNLTAGGGSVTVTCSVKDTYNTRRDYTSGSYDTSTRTVDGTACWRITSNGNNRFGYSGTAHSHSSTNYYDNGTKATHSSMGKSVGTDTVGITAYNHNDLSQKSSEKTASVTNSVGAYYDTSVNTYGTPSLSLANNLTAGGGSVTVTCTVTDTYNTRRDYTSGSYDTSTRTADGTACWRITSNGNSRFGYSGTAHSHSSTNYYDNGTKATHSSMGKSVGTDTVGITAYNHNDLSKKSSEKTASVTNEVGAYYDTSVNTYGIPSLTLTNNLTVSGGSVTVTCSVTDTYNTRRDYTSGSYDTSTRTATGTACWRITSNGNNRFAYSGSAHGHSSTNYYNSGTTATHSSMTTNATTDTVGITAYNHADLSKKSSEKTASVTNSSWWEYDNVTSCSISYSNSVCRNDNGITVSPSTSATQKKRIRYSTNSTSNETNCTITKTYSMTKGSGASINTSTGVITWEENKSTSARTSNTITCTFKGEGDKSNTATCTASQSAGYYTYATPSVGLSYNTNASCGSSSNTSPTNSPSLSYSQTYGWNGRTSGAGTVSSGASVSYSMTAGSGASSINSSTGVVTWSENQTLSSRTNNTVSVSVTLNGKTGSKSNVSTSQSAGYYTYATPSVGLSYNTNASCGSSSNTSPTNSPSLSYSQTYGWNGRTSGVGTVSSGASSVSYSMTAGSGASSINSSTGVVTWSENQTLSARTNKTVSVSVTVNGKTGSKSNVSTSQSAGYYTYSELSGGSLSYVNKNAASGTVSPSVSSPTQTYGWNGRTSGIGSCTVTAGNYSMTTGNGASINTSNGNITWKANEAGAQRTSNEVSITYAGSGSKTKTLTATATQLADEVSKHSATTSIGSGITAGGGKATVSGSCTRTWVSGYKDYPGISKVEITSQSIYTGVDLTGTASSITRYSVSSTTLSHTTMGTTTGSDYVKITTTFTDGCTATASTYVNNTVGAYYDTSVNTFGTPSLTLTDNLTAGGGSVTVTCSVTDIYNTRRDYTSGSCDTSTRKVTGTACWRITSNGNSRFSHSGTAHTHDGLNYYYSGASVTHSSMTNNVGTDTVGITAYNHSDLSKTSGKTASVSNSLQSTKYKSKSTSDKGFNATYGTPTISIGSGITAAGGSATISASVTNTAKWYQIYDSGTWTGEQSSSNGSVISNAVSLSINSQYIATSSNADSGTTITRFSISGTTLKHSSMDKSTGWDTVNVKVTNDVSTSKTATARTYVQNSVSAWKNTTVYAYGTPSKVTFSGSSNESRCAGGNTTMSATVTDTYSRKRTYTSGSVDTDTKGTAAGTVGYEFVSRTCNDGSTATSYWGITGSTLTHRSMGINWVTDYCVVRAYNAGSSTIKGANSDELSASNGRSEVNIKYYASCSISNGITASGGSATVSYSGYHTANWKYASGTTDSSLHETNDGATIKITSQSCAGGATRFSLNGSTLSHTNMGTTTGTDSVTITATNSANSTGTTTASKSVTNSLESISITLGNSAVSKPGGDASGHPSSAHYDLAYNSTTSPTVTATYTSGSTANVTSSSTITSSDTTVATVS